MTDKKAIKDLVVCSFYGTNPDPSKFSNADIKNTLREEIHKIAHDYDSYRRNKYDLFEIMQEAYTEIVPRQIEDFMGSFAEIKTVPNGQKAQFVVNTGRRRAKQFITEVGLSGVYESFRLDKRTFEVGAKAIGGTAYIDFERYISGDEDITESTDILIEGYQEAIFGEVQKALLASVNDAERPTKNKHIGAGFDADAMAQLCAVAGSYGNGGVTIFATPEFVAAMGPDAIGLPIYAPSATTAGKGYGYATPVYSPRDIEDIANTGYIKTFRGNPIVQIPQSFTDETNETTVMNPAVAYIFPNGQAKPVKIVFEGDMRLDDWQHRDRSFEIEVYGKVGVAILTTYNWCLYVNTELDYDTNTKYALELNG
jgi:hypothetical protein